MSDSTVTVPAARLERRIRRALWLVLTLSACFLLLALSEVIASAHDRESSLVVGTFSVLPSVTALLAGTVLLTAIRALRYRNGARRMLVFLLQLSGSLCLGLLAFLVILLLQPGSVPFVVASRIFLPGLVIYALLAGLAFCLAFFLSRQSVRARFSSTL